MNIGTLPLAFVTSGWGDASWAEIESRLSNGASAADASRVRRVTMIDLSRKTKVDWDW
jgi:hypothetical protein